jgi:hypothetical protein
LLSGDPTAQRLPKMTPKTQVHEFRVSLMLPRVAQSSEKTGQMKEETILPLMMSCMCHTFGQTRRSSDGYELLDLPTVEKRNCILGGHLNDGLSRILPLDKEGLALSLLGMMNAMSRLRLHRHCVLLFLCSEDSSFDSVLLSRHVGRS